MKKVCIDDLVDFDLELEAEKMCLEELQDTALCLTKEKADAKRRCKAYPENYIYKLILDEIKTNIEKVNLEIDKRR